VRSIRGKPRLDRSGRVTGSGQTVPPLRRTPTINIINIERDASRT
jgi:hypothetical protein